MPEAKRARNGEHVPVVLGTSSKWRRVLFAKHFPEYGNDFMAADIDEKAIRLPRPEDMTIAIASAKADALLPHLAGRDVLLVCLDQVICCEDEVREKPESEAQAREFLESYRNGKGAKAVNGIVVHNTRTGRRVTGTDCATMHWKPFPDSVIEHFLEEKEIFNSAGAFIAGDEQMKPYIDRIDGAVDSIEGLPVAALRALLLRAAAPPATHVIFDMDGLLLDTETAYTVAQQEVLDRFDKKFTWELKAKMMGRKALEASQLLVDELSLQGKISAEGFLAERNVILDKLFADAKLLPGVGRLVRHLHKHGVPIAVATSSNREHFELKTSKHREFFGLFNHIVTGDRVSKSKPDPEIFLEAARQFVGGAPEASSVLVFEDAPVGVEAGLAAGMQVCHVPDANLALELRGRAHAELPSLEVFKPEEWGLPPF